MAILHVREIPDALYKRLQKMARAHGRTLSAEVIALLEQAVRDDEMRRQQAKLLKRIRQNRWTPPHGAPEASEMIREAREG